MNRKTKLGFGFILMMIMLIGNVIGVQAAGTTSIAVSKSSATVGDSVSVTVQGTESSTISVKYNASVLTLSSCSAEGYTTSGNVITFTGTTASIKFSAAAEGKSSVIVSSDSLDGSSTAVNVAAKAADTTTSNNDSSKATGQFTIDGEEYVVSERYSSSEIPAGFSKTKVEIDGGSYNELSNGSMTLLYLKPASNTSGSGEFYIYNEEDGSVTSMMLVGTQEQYVIILTPDSMMLDNLTEATCTIEEVDYSMYQLSGDESDFYYLYGVDQNQQEGWFQYDSKEATVQRVNDQLISTLATEDSDEEATTETTTTDNWKDKVLQSRYIIAGLVVVIVVLVIVVINIKLFKKNRDEDYDDEEEIDDDINFDKKEEEEQDTLFYQNDDDRTKEMFMDDHLENEEDQEIIQKEKKAPVMTIDELPTNEEMSQQRQQEKIEDLDEIEEPEEEVEEKLNRRERRRKRKLEEDIFADFDEPVKPIKTPKKSKTSDDNDSHLEVIDLNDL